MGGATRHDRQPRPEQKVSIHAPMGGATDDNEIKEKAIKVSIHAPMGGATDARISEQSPYHSFNPRAHGGRDNNN